MTVLNTLPRVAQFMGVSRDQIVDHGAEGKFRVLVYGAYNANGLIGPEMNGIAILREDPPAVVTDGICQQDSGYFGPSEQQIATFNKVVAMKWPEFRALVNQSDRARFEI